MSDFQQVDRLGECELQLAAERAARVRLQEALEYVRGVAASVQHGPVGGQQAGISPWNMTVGTKKEILRTCDTALTGAAPGEGARGWQPIATAPMDGSSMLVRLRDRASNQTTATTARWYWVSNPSQGWWQDYHARSLTAPGGSVYGPYEVTHWMPLSEPPQPGPEA